MLAFLCKNLDYKPQSINCLHRDLYRFLHLLDIFPQARDLETWASEMMTEMSTEQQVQHVGSVIALKERHQQLRAEIDTREDIFSSVIDTGKAMIDGQHFASEEVSVAEEGGRGER